MPDLTPREKAMVEAFPGILGALAYILKEIRFMDEPQRRDYLFAAFGDSVDFERLEAAVSLGMAIMEAPNA